VTEGLMCALDTEVQAMIGCLWYRNHRENHSNWGKTIQVFSNDSTTILRTLGVTDLTTQHHVTEDLNLQQCHCENQMLQAGKF